MVTQETLRNITRLSNDEAITRTFLDLVVEYLANADARRWEITDELYLLIALCNHHRQVLGILYRQDRMVDPQLRTWIHEFATSPTGEWAELRLSLTPFIRLFGALPRPRGSRLFSPMMPSNPEGGQGGPVLGAGVRLGWVIGDPVN
jgi:hypothetical protein